MTEAEARSRFLSLAITVYESRHSGRFRNDEEARKAYCLGFLDGAIEAARNPEADDELYEDISQARAQHQRRMLR